MVRSHHWVGRPVDFRARDALAFRDLRFEEGVVVLEEERLELGLSAPVHPLIEGRLQGGASARFASGVVCVSYERTPEP